MEIGPRTSRSVRPHCAHCGNLMHPEEDCFRCPSCSITYCNMGYPEHKYGIDGHSKKPEPGTPHPSEVIENAEEEKEA